MTLLRAQYLSVLEFLASSRDGETPEAIATHLQKQKIKDDEGRTPEAFAQHCIEFLIALDCIQPCDPHLHITNGGRIHLQGDARIRISW